MKKVLALIVATFVLSFSGCSSKSAEAADSKMTKPATAEVSAYLLGDYVDVETAKSKLTEAGFDVVATYAVDKRGEYTTIIFTSAALKSAANEDDRGFAAILRLLVNHEKQEISITSPIYFGKAFMQDAFNYEAAVAVEESLTKVFGTLSGSDDKWEYEGLADYHFMMSMPYYKESTILAEGDNSALIEKAKAYKKGKNLVFTLEIGEGRTLLGYTLGRKTSKFVKKIGYQNANVLPYTILVEDGKAKMLAPKYYIAIAYPQLTMGEFMTIASVPGAIEKDLAKPFK